MKNNLISIADICSHEKIEINFVYALADFGLISTQAIDKAVFIDVDELPKLSKYMHLHQDLDINLEGLHAVSHLLNQLEDVQNRMMRLQNELNYYRQLERFAE